MLPGLVSYIFDRTFKGLNNPVQSYYNIGRAGEPYFAKAT